jgi:hypothetical protein
VLELKAFGIPMTQKNRPSVEEQEPKSLTESSRSGKKNYKKPAFRSERVFETMALSCGKLSPAAPNCKHRRRAS